MHARTIAPVALAAAAMLLTACNNTPVTIAPPRIPQGGRALSISVAANDPRHMAVASETGGLFRTYNGGVSWQHLDGLPNHLTIDVAIASSNPDIMIATTWPQYRSINDGGIWRSTDGGGTWSQPAGWSPTPSHDCPSRPGAYGISHMPLSNTFFVGTDCGISVSNDNGVHWSYIVLNPTATGSDSLQHRVRSVLVINRTSGVAAADAGLFNIGAGGTWVKSQDVQTSGQAPVIHAFASPWWGGANPPVFYHASGGQMLWVSSDNGATWTQVPAPSAANREAFVRVALPRSGDDQHFDVWYGDGFALQHQMFSFSALTGDSSWDHPQVDHRDPSDIGFDLEQRIPTLLATDGGVHVTADSGSNWKLIGSAYGGYIALQINEITGQAVTGSSPHTDLYFSTHDDDLKASPDGGATWGPHICCEGQSLRIAPMSVDHAGVRFTGAACSPCHIKSTSEHFTNEGLWPNAPDGNNSEQGNAPFLIAGDAYLQEADDPNAMPPTFDFFLTLSAGSGWAKTYSLMFGPKGPPMFAGSLANPTVYQGVRRPGAISNGGPRFGLLRITNLAGQAVVSSADSTGMGGIGVLRTAQAGYEVFAADPMAPTHLIAPDVGAGVMASSADGGISWHPMSGLTQAVTDSGRYLFALQSFSFATAIAWDPYDECHILVGTMQNGIMRSTDGGVSWARIPGSKNITYVSSFFFPPTGSVWVSSNGRGLWTLSLDRHPNGAAGTRCRYPGARTLPVTVDTVFIVDPVTGAQRPFGGPGDSSICTGCAIVLIRNGWVTDLDRSDDVVKVIAISGGTISEIDRNGRERALSIPNVYRAGNGQLGAIIPRSAVTGGRRVRGLVLDGARLVRLITSERELPFAPARTPMVFVRNATKGGGPSVSTGDSVRVIGTGFVPHAHGGEPVRILFEDRIVIKAVPVAEDGSFSTVLPVRQPPGELVVTAEQRDGLRTTAERATIDVTGNDRDEGVPDKE